MNEPITECDRLLKEAEACPSPLKLVCGTYDFLQPGNLQTLQEAASGEGSLMVLLPNDTAVKEWAGANRPFHSAADRLAFMNHLSAVELCGILPLSGIDDFFTALPHYTFYGCPAQPGPLTERAAQHAAQRHDVPEQPGCSTSAVVNAIHQQRSPIACEGIFPGKNTNPVRPLVTVNGCFDILHLGHLDMLNKAKAMGQSLTVLINSDESVKRYKGPTRPVFPEWFRAEALLALKMVDDVMVFAEDTPLSLLESLKPEIHVKGGSYEPDRVRLETELLEDWGGEVRFCPLLEGYSTSSIIQAVG